MDRTHRADHSLTTIHVEPEEQIIRVIDRDYGTSIVSPPLKSRELSSRTRRVKLEHDLQREDQEYDNTWKSCCGHTIDRRAAVFFTSIGITAVLLGFSIYQLLTNKDCRDQAPYIAIISAVIGVYLPQPNMNKSSK